MLLLKCQKYVLGVLNGFLSPFQGAIDNKYHVEKLNYHGMLHMPLYFVLLNIDLPTKHLVLCSGFVSSFSPPYSQLQGSKPLAVEK